MRRNAVPSFAAMATVLVTVLVLGVFIPIVQATTGAANEVRGRVIADVYLQRRHAGRHRPRAHAARGHPARQERRSSSPRSRPTRSRRSATPRPTSCSAPTRCPTPSASPRTTPDNIAAVRNALAPLAPVGRGPRAGRQVDRRGPQPRGRHQQDPHRHARREATRWPAWRSLLAIASMLLIGNTIRLSLYARRREVEVMKLVGATDWFIRWPFVLEGILLGALGGVLAIVLLGVIKVALVDPLANDFALIAAPDTINFGVLVVVLLVASVGVSALRLRPLAAPLPAGVGFAAMRPLSVGELLDAAFARRAPQLRHARAVHARGRRPGGDHQHADLRVERRTRRSTSPSTHHDHRGRVGPVHRRDDRHRRCCRCSPRR